MEVSHMSKELYIWTCKVLLLLFLFQKVTKRWEIGLLIWFPWHLVPFPRGNQFPVCPFTSSVCWYRSAQWIPSHFEVTLFGRGIAPTYRLQNQRDEGQVPAEWFMRCDLSKPLYLHLWNGGGADFCLCKLKIQWVTFCKAQYPVHIKCQQWC